MDDREALLRAVAANPDDDLPRLVFADWLDEHDDAAYAAFIRAQVELANTPPWEPFAVRCRHRHGEEWVKGTPFRRYLPEVDGRALEWHADAPFRRGFAWALVVRDMATFFEEAPRLFEEAPVGQLHLPTATLDDWRRFARQSWLPRVKSIHFYGTRPPVEPVLELSESPQAGGIEEVVFEASGSPGMPVVVQRLMQSPLGRRLKRLELRVGPNGTRDTNDLFDAIAHAPPGELEALRLVNMSRGDRGLSSLYFSHVLDRLTEFELIDVPWSWTPYQWGRFPSIMRLSAVGCRFGYVGEPEGSSRVSAPPAGLRSLDLSGNPMETWSSVAGGTGVLEGLVGLRSLTLQRTLLVDASLEERLTGSSCWPNLVEVDLRTNYITDVGAERLIDAQPPREMTALLLSRNRISPEMQRRLRDHFGDAVDLDVDESGTGLR